MNEKYIPLYRKYRPQTLSEVVGQEHVKKALSNAIKLNKISHAYLFTGPRGTGKTSCARILAKSLNCQNGPTTDPCGKCPSCIDIINSTPIDVIEIDAASNRKVEDTQAILDKIQYVPVNGKFKIYIIDEVHMLSTHAFNALLKTLEEPPENVIFILATTEPQKVLDTIKSRCQRFDFKRITTEDIKNHLKMIASKEKINIDDDALLTIAKNSAGGMRDSLALLDQLSVFDIDKTITIEEINTLLGRISFDKLKDISDSIFNSTPQDAILHLENIYNLGNEPSQILINLLDYFKNVLVIKTCEANSVLNLTQLNESQVATIQKQIENIETHQIVFLIERVSYYIKELKTTTNPKLWLEVAMIDLSNLQANTSLLELQNRISALESGEINDLPTKIVYKAPTTEIKSETGTQFTPTTNPIPITKTTSQAPINPKKVAETEDKQENSDEFSPMPKVEIKSDAKAELRTLWISMLQKINDIATQSWLRQNGSPVEITPESVVITFKKEVWVKQLNMPTRKSVIVKAADDLFNQTNSNVTIRLALPTDVQVSISPEIIKTTSEKVEQQEINPAKEINQSPKYDNKNIEETDLEQNSDEYDIPAQEANDNQKSDPDDILKSDLTIMAKNLFKGKYID